METYSNLEKLSNDLKNLFQNQNQNQNQNESYFDFEIICEQNKTSFKTHKSILSSRKFLKSPFFLELEENHLNSILSSDEIFTNEFGLFQKIIKWGKHKLNINQEKELEKEEKEKLQDQISNIVDKIRFIDFTKKEMQDTLKEDLIPIQISKPLTQLLTMKIEKNKEELYEFIKNENQNQNSFIFKPRIGLKSTIIIQEVEHFKKLKEWINDDEFFYKMKKGYSAKRDGFNSQNWHSKCDEKGKTLIIIKTKDNYIFGGFTKVGWTNDKSKWREKDRGDDYGWIIDPNAFIFSLRNDKNNREPEKFTIQERKEETAIRYYVKSGPNFGGGSGDIVLYSNLQPGFVNFGDTYNIPNGIRYNSN
ncbi:pep-cterm sorting domain-containing protein [Anaeramoeba ignava]|uniref:Pep-cterm sorting domain-containing protein n=1 Tax=Anaeramoeba ignava TaxID=1746090 RepID=A0A9Q0LFC8_ANAIG|nr:pep-cterm sorting domain-containing protein [Anaeramoeba ignava]